MKLEQQVVSLELAQKLKELGVKQESFFIWKQCINKQLACYQIPTVSTHKNVDNDDEIIASAFTVAELGEMLPSGLSKDGKNYRIHIVNGNGLKYLDYVTYENGTPTFLLQGYPMLANSKDTEADARAKMLIYLLENKLITLC